MADENLSIEVVRAPNAEHVRAISKLLPQLSSAAPPDLGRLRSIAETPGTELLFARLGGDLVGTLTLHLFSIPTGIRAWIEDVIVDADRQGAGIGKALVKYALDIAEAAGVRSVDLTSRPSREAANRLYQGLGFYIRETNVYRYLVEDQAN